MQDHTVLPGDRSVGGPRPQVRAASSPGPVCGGRPPPVSSPERAFGPSSQAPSLFPHPPSWSGRLLQPGWGVTEQPHPSGHPEQVTARPWHRVVEGRRGRVTEGLRQRGCCGRRLGWGLGASLTRRPRAPSVPLPGGLHGDQVLCQQVRALRRGRHRLDPARVLLQC